MRRLETFSMDKFQNYQHISNMELFQIKRSMNKFEINMHLMRAKNLSKN